MKGVIVSPHGYAVVWPPLKCACGRMAAFLVNRDGKTRCVDCDARNQKPAQ